MQSFKLLEETTKLSKKSQKVEELKKESSSKFSKGAENNIF